MKEIPSLSQVSQTSLRSVIGAQHGGSMDLGWRDRLYAQFRLGWSHEYADVSRPVTASLAAQAAGLPYDKHLAGGILRHGLEPLADHGRAAARHVVGARGIPLAVVYGHDGVEQVAVTVSHSGYLKRTSDGSLRLSPRAMRQRISSAARLSSLRSSADSGRADHFGRRTPLPRAPGIA